MIGNALVTLRFAVKNSKNARVSIYPVELAFEFLKEVEGLCLAWHESKLHLDVKFAK